MAEVLVVDDDAEIRSALRLVLEDEQYTVFEAPDGESALTRLRTHPSPLVVLLDWHMPGIDGIQVLNALASDTPLTHRHAFILLTAAAVSDVRPLPSLSPKLDVQVMGKPFDIDDLLLMVRDAVARVTGPQA